MVVKPGLLPWEEQKLRLFEKKWLKRLLGHKIGKVTNEYKKFIMKTFIICA